MSKRRKPNPERVDEDNPEWTAAHLKRAKPLSGFPELERLVGRGRPKSEATKETITIRLDPKVVKYFRAQGRGWQTRVNDTLAAYVSRQLRRNG